MGVFIVGSIGEPCNIPESLVELSHTLANLAALTIKNALLYEERQVYAAQLEKTLAERIKAEEEREKLHDELVQAQKMESVGRLASGIAHDFNNMLGTIITNIDLALLKVDSDQPIYSNLQETMKAAESSASLTQQLLAFARKQKVQPKVIDLNDSISQMLNIIHRLIGEDINLVWQPGGNIWPINIDPSQLDQILTNLAVNARDAIIDVGNLTIETTNIVLDDTFFDHHINASPGEYVALIVSDDGTGMNKETKQQIFEPFFTTKGLGLGTGLGLSTIFGIINQNNGYIDVDSEPGLGTTFKIYLPRYNGADGLGSDHANYPK